MGGDVLYNLENGKGFQMIVTDLIINLLSMCDRNGVSPNKVHVVYREDYTDASEAKDILCINEDCCAEDNKTLDTIALMESEKES